MTFRSLELGLMEGIEMGLFNRKKNVENKDTQDKDTQEEGITRRQALGKIGGFIAGVATGGLLASTSNADIITDNSGQEVHYVGQANGKDTNLMETTPLGRELMGVRGKNEKIRTAMHKMTAIEFFEMVFDDVNIKGYPPGITNSKYSNILKQMWDVRKDRAELHKYFGVHSIKEGKSPLLTTPEIFKEEPAVYLLASFMYDNCDVYAKDVIGLNHKENQAMIQFAKGMSKYTSAYIFLMEGYKELKGTIDLQNDIEVPFLNSIFSAAGYTNGLNDYFHKDKKEVMDKTMDLLYYKDYKNQLIASWSAKWLSDNYNIKDDGKNLEATYYHLEKPLRNFTGRIRAPKGKEKYYSNMT